MLNALMLLRLIPKLCFGVGGVRDIKLKLGRNDLEAITLQRIIFQEFTVTKTLSWAEYLQCSSSLI